MALPAIKKTLIAAASVRAGVRPSPTLTPPTPIRPTRPPTPLAAAPWPHIPNTRRKPITLPRPCVAELGPPITNPPRVTPKTEGPLTPLSATPQPRPLAIRRPAPLTRPSGPPAEPSLIKRRTGGVGRACALTRKRTLRHIAAARPVAALISAGDRRGAGDHHGARPIAACRGRVSDRRWDGRFS